jgi:hypothetical protein
LRLTGRADKDTFAITSIDDSILKQPDTYGFNIGPLAITKNLKATATNMKKLNLLLLFSASLSFFAIFLPAGHLPSDTQYSLATAQSMCKGSLDISPSENLPYLSKGINGQYYSKYGPGYALMFIPSAIIANHFFKLTRFNAAQLHQILVSFTNTFIAAICMVLFVTIMRKCTIDFKIIVISSALIASCSLLLPYSKINHSELPSTLLLLLFASVWYDCTNLTLKKGALIGLIISCLLLLKIGNAISALVIAACCIQCIMSGRSTKAGISLVIILPFLTLMLLIALNIYRFGSWSNFGYGPEQHEFSTPMLEGLLSLCLSPSKSMFLFSPLLIFSIIGAVHAFSENKRFHSMIVILFISNLLFYSTWHDWHGGWSWGPRLITPVIILMHVYLPFFIRTLTLKNNTAFNAIKISTFSILIVIALSINLLGALIWYQQIYYFHRDYSSLEYSHPVIAFKLFTHKLENQPETYTCSTFNRNCNQPPYSTVWKSITTNETIDFDSFETFQGYSTFWGYLRSRTTSDWFLLFPFLFLSFSLLFIYIYLILNRCSLNQFQEKTIFQ